MRCKTVQDKDLGASKVRSWWGFTLWLVCSEMRWALSSVWTVQAPYSTNVPGYTMAIMGSRLRALIGPERLTLVLYNNTLGHVSNTPKYRRSAESLIGGRLG